MAVTPSIAAGGERASHRGSLPPLRSGPAPVAVGAAAGPGVQAPAGAGVAAACLGAWAAGRRDEAAPGEFGCDGAEVHQLHRRCGGVPGQDLPVQAQRFGSPAAAYKLGRDEAERSGARAARTAALAGATPARS